MWGDHPSHEMWGDHPSVKETRQQKEHWGQRLEAKVGWWVGVVAQKLKKGGGRQHRVSS